MPAPVATRSSPVAAAAVGGVKPSVIWQVPPLGKLVPQVVAATENAPVSAPTVIDVAAALELATVTTRGVAAVAITTAPKSTTAGDAVASRCAAVPDNPRLAAGLIAFDDTLTVAVNAPGWFGSKR